MYIRLFWTPEKVEIHAAENFANEEPAAGKHNNQPVLALKMAI